MSTDQARAGQAPPIGGALPFTSVQRARWQRRRSDPIGLGHVRALRLTGTVDDDRLAAGAEEVIAAVDALHLAYTEAPGEPPVVRAAPPRVRHHELSNDPTPDAAERDRRCVQELAAQRHSAGHAGVATVTVTIVRLSADEAVLAVAGDPLLVDVRSLYLLLGAIMQAYLGRFRAAEYPAFAAAALPAATAPVPATRLAWWARQLERWRCDQVSKPGSTVSAPGDYYAVLALNRDRWRRLCQVSEHAGNTGSIAVVALLTWWTRGRTPVRPAVYQTTLDLREYLGLGPVIGPLTDSIAFAVDLAGAEDMTFRDLVGRVHAGLLDSVVRYVPSDALRTLAHERGIRDAPWDVLVHYCRTPPTSDTTRGEETLARHGLSIELFCEAQLARLGSQAGLDHAALELDLAEHADGVGLLVRADTSRVSQAEVDALLHGLDRMIDVVTAAPTIALADI